MKDFIYIDEVPIEELFPQVCSANYNHLAMISIAVRKNQLIREIGPLPAGTFFRTKANPHDAGTYYDITFYYDDENAEHLNYAMRLENSSMRWDTEAIAEINDLDPHYFDLVVESNTFQSPKLNAFFQEIRRLMNS